VNGAGLNLLNAKKIKLLIVALLSQSCGCFEKKGSYFVCVIVEKHFADKL
jgi:hypothetical protein